MGKIIVQYQIYHIFPSSRFDKVNIGFSLSKDNYEQSTKKTTKTILANTAILGLRVKFIHTFLKEKKTEKDKKSFFSGIKKEKIYIYIFLQVSDSVTHSHPHIFTMFFTSRYIYFIDMP